jgi:hypothetical protein
MSFGHMNIVPFRSARRASSPRRDQKGLMEAVYTAGSLPIQPDDRESKVMAARLQVFGFVNVDEIQPDGTTRRLRPSEAIEASTSRPWRVSKPSFSGLSLAAREMDPSLFEPRPAV